MNILQFSKHLDSLSDYMKLLQYVLNVHKSMI